MNMDGWGPSQWLATLNATLNAAAAASVIAGLRAIRRGRVARHRAWMLTAFGCSVAFLVSYLIRVVLFGDTRYAGPESLRTAFYVMLGSHVLLSVVLVPLVLVTLRRGLRGYLEKHRAIARWTAPIWLYVSATGVLVFVALHVLGRLP